MTAPTIDTENSRDRTKRGFRIAVAVPVIIAAMLALLGVSIAMNSIARDEEVDDIFTDAAQLPPELVDEVVWRPDPELARQVDPLTRDALTAAWLRAWEQFTIVSATGDLSGVDTYFAGPARDAVLEQGNLWDGRSVEQLGHELEIRFLSSDGQVAQLHSHASRLRRTDEQDDRTFAQETNETYDAVLILEDGNWRINHLIRRSFEAGEWATVE